MNTILPIAQDTSSGTNATSSSTSTANSAAASNELNANSFITLLTTQLQAQDPLNPLDPTQMVGELTQMNTLQELIQIRQDMDSLLQAAQNGGPAPAPASSGTGATSSAASVASSFAAPAATANSLSAMF